MIPASLTRSLVGACGRDGVIVDEDRLVVYESDALTAYRHRPGAVVLPRTTAQVRAVVRAIAQHGLPIVPRGAGTGLSGGAVALDGAVVVGTARMNRILAIDAANRRAVLQPGVINSELSEAARPHGLHYAPDPSSQTACTIGGNVAENSGGPHCLKYGVTSRYVTGLTVVLADGSAVRLGGRGRDAPGYDLVGLFVGSEGCFGIATEIEVGLLPLPEGVRTLLGVFDRIEDAGRAVSDIVSAGLLPAAMEIVDGPTIRAVEDSVFAAGYPTDAEAALVIEFDGMEAGLDADTARAAAFCADAGAREVRSARDENERTALWKGRKKAFGALGRIAPDLLVQDATVPRTTLPSILRGISEIGKRYRLVVANVFHAGDGNLHPNILFDRRDRDELERVERASGEIMQLCVDSGGTITGEHGVGLDKKHHMPLIHGPAELRAMWGVRRVFDPAGVMNPGKVLPEPPPAGGARDGSGVQEGRPATAAAARP
ncbi:MAG: FAD-binding protein [Gemmatimonadota bacterium]|nr:FAD-binding protein [Gemmatimonadota bacterium]MDE2873201.1 FAD-binding protein [Gemmatimonadota bacterium]